MESESTKPIESPAIQSDFAEIVKESKESIVQAEMVPPKGKPGRKKAPRDANGNIVRDPSKRVSGGAAGPSVASGSPAGAPPPDISKSLIAPLYMLSKIPADRTKIPELALQQDEATALAQSLSDLYAVFAPNGQMSPKTAAICNVSLVAGSILLTKYQIYLEKKPKRTPDAPPPEVQQQINPNQPFPTIPAEEAFRRRQ